MENSAKRKCSAADAKVKIYLQQQQEQQLEQHEWATTGEKSLHKTGNMWPALRLCSQWPRRGARTLDQHARRGQRCWHNVNVNANVNVSCKTPTQPATFRALAMLGVAFRCCCCCCRRHCCCCCCCCCDASLLRLFGFGFSCPCSHQVDFSFILNVVRRVRGRIALSIRARSSSYEPRNQLESNRIELNCSWRCCHFGLANTKQQNNNNCQ